MVNDAVAVILEEGVMMEEGILQEICENKIVKKEEEEEDKDNEDEIAVKSILQDYQVTKKKQLYGPLLWMGFKLKD